MKPLTSGIFAASERNRDTAPAYWQVDILWMILASGVETDGAYSVIEELCPKNSGPPPHTHTQLEIFYLLEGEITFLVNGAEILGQPGSMITIPPGAVHSFRVDSEVCRILNMYIPAGFERSVIELGEPAPSRVLPPTERKMTASPEEIGALFEEIGMQPVNQPDRLRMSP